MTIDDNSDDIFDWRLVQEAAREHRHKRRSPHAGNRGISGTKNATERKDADCVPFPLVRRRAFISKLIARMIARPAAASEAYLVQQLRRQAVVLQRKGVKEALIRRELRAVEGTVRAGLWRAIFDTQWPGGGT